MSEYEVNERSPYLTTPIKEIAPETKAQINDIFHEHTVLYRDNNNENIWCEFVMVEFDRLHGNEIYKMLDLGFRLNYVDHAEYNNGRIRITFYPVVP